MVGAGDRAPSRGQRDDRAIRLRRLIAEDTPVIQGYDQDEFARRLFYDRPISLPCSCCDSRGRPRPNSWIACSPTTGHARAPTANTARTGVEQWLKIYSGHAHKHAEQITRARAKAVRG